MADPTAVSEPGDGLRAPARSKYVRWGGLAAFFGPLLVLAANMYGLWETRTYGAGAEGVIEASTTTPYIVFGGVRLLGGTLLVFGLVALYAYQVRAAGRLGLIGFVVSMLGTVLLTAQAWFLFFVAPGLAAEAPAFIELALAGEVGPLLNVGLFIPIITQAIGWVIFGIATYRAGVFPRRAAAVLIIGALLLFVPVEGSPVVFQLAIAWLGYLAFSGRIAPLSAEEMASPTS